MNIYPKKPGSFSGVTSFIKELKRRKKISNKTDFETFFLKNETSSIHKPIRNKFLRNKTGRGPSARAQL